MVAVLLLVAAAAGCGEQAKAKPPEQPGPGDAVVKLYSVTFEPSDVTVQVGHKVIWQWTDSVVHNVVAKEFSSKNQGGGSYSVPFDKPGRHDYTCTLHHGMNGTVVVTP